MRHFLFTLIITCSIASVFGRTYNERIADAMNHSDWFGLDSIYNSAPKDSIMDFLEVYSRCLTGNRLNRPDVSIPAFDELFAKHSENLDLNNLLSSTIMFGMDLSRTGQNQKAAEITKAVMTAVSPHVDSATVANLQDKVNLYTVLSDFDPYTIEFPAGEQVGQVDFRLVPIGPPDKGSVLMHLNDSKINGLDADITFDTGAGINIIADSLAERYNLIPLDAKINVLGVNDRYGQYAIAKELKLGNMTLRDVPFCVLNISSDNAIADQYIGGFSIIVGSDLMLQLKDLTIDFVKRRITVPESATAKSDTPANLCFSSTMNLLTKGSVMGDAMLMNIDTGDADYGSLGYSFYQRNKNYITTHALPDSVREAGIAGTICTPAYKLPDIAVNLGGYTVNSPCMTVKAEENKMRGGYDCNLGIKTLMLFGKLHFNLVDFTLTAEPDERSYMSPAKLNAPSFKLTAEKGPSALQTIGFIGLAVARAIMYPDISTQPDL